MKNLTLILALAAALSLAGNSQAQVTNASPSGSFLNSTVSYFTSFNTNLDSTFGESKGQLWTGVDSIQGGAVPIANVLGVSYDLWKSQSATSISAESVTRDSGVAGTILSEQLGVGLNFVIHDAKLTLYVDGGYDIYSPDKAAFSKRLFAEIGLRAQKALTEHTFAGVGLGAQLPNSRQVLSAFAGVSF